MSTYYIVCTWGEEVLYYMLMSLKFGPDDITKNHVSSTIPKTSV